MTVAMETTDDVRRERLRAAGELLFGAERCGAQLAKALGCTTAHVSRMLKGNREITPAMERRLVEACVAHSVELTRRAAEATALAHQIAGSGIAYLKAVATTEEQREKAANDALEEYYEGRYGRDWRDRT